MNQDNFVAPDDKIENDDVQSSTEVDSGDAVLSAKEQFQRKMAMFKKARAQQDEILGAVPDQILSEVETEQDSIAEKLIEKEETNNAPLKKTNSMNEKVMGIMQKAQQERDEKLAQQVRANSAHRTPRAGTDGSDDTSTSADYVETQADGASEAPPPPPPPPPPVDAKVEVKIDNNGLNAIAIIDPPQYNGEEINAEMLQKALDAKDIKFGISENALREIVAQRIYNEWVEVAVGTPPIDGENGVLNLHFDVDNNGGPRQNEDGTVNYKELGIVNNVVAGDVLATATLPTEGESGISVQNKEIAQKKGVAATLPAGNGTQVSEDGLILTAAVDGNLEYKNNVFSITQIFEIKGNVDNATGNINFVGSVKVTGDVRAGFSIVSGGDIKVNGMVEGAVLEAAGNISVDTGINGMGTGKIVAMGEIKAKFIESCEVESGNNLYSEAIINSDVKCDGDLIMTKGKGAIMGGNVLVAKNLTAITIGSISNIATNVTIGYTARLTEKIKAARKNLENMQNDLVKLDQVIIYLTDLYNKKTITPQRYELLKQSIYSRNSKAEEMDLLNIELMAMEEEFNAPTKSILRCTGIINPGVKINISNYTYRVSTELNKCMLYLNDGEIVVGQG